MTVRIDSPPDPSRSDVRTVLFGTWRVGTPERQRATVEAIAAAWEARPWPTPELLSYSILADTEGETLLHYSQMGSPDSHAISQQDPRWKDEVDAAVPGIERIGVVGYHLYRSRVDQSNQPPGCIVVVTPEFDGPDPERARQWVDAMFALPDEPTPGLLSAHFHVSTDGSRVLNYAQWTSAETHRAAAEAPLQEALEDPEWTRVLNWPGLSGITFKRFHFQLQLAPAPAPR